MSILQQYSAEGLSYRTYDELNDKLGKAQWCMESLTELGDTESISYKSLRSIRNKLRQAIDIKERRDWEFEQLNKTKA